MKPLMDKRKHESNGSNIVLESQETRAVLPDLATDSSWETGRNSLVSELLLLSAWGPFFWSYSHFERSDPSSCIPRLPHLEAMSIHSLVLA